MRDVATKRLEYDRLRAELVALVMQPGGVQSRRFDEINARLREMLRQDGVYADTKAKGPEAAQRQSGAVKGGQHQGPTVGGRSPRPRQVPPGI